MTTIAATHRSAIKRYRKRWLDLGLSTEPACRPLAEAGTDRAYQEAGLPSPKRIIWVASPHEATQRIASGLEKETLSSSAWQTVFDSVMNRVVTAIQNRVGREDYLTLRQQFVAPGRKNPLYQLRIQQTSMLRSSFHYGYGCHDADWMAFYDFCEGVHAIQEVNLIHGIMEVARHAGWWCPFETECIVTERPSALNADLLNTPSADKKPIIAYQDGWGLAWLNRIQVPWRALSNPLAITVSEINGTNNLELRRVLIYQYGQERYLKDSGAEVLHQDDFGVLYRLERSPDEPLHVVKVTNATPEKDRTFRDYFLSVPPEMKTARQAVAWTFGKAENDYAPIIET